MLASFARPAMKVHLGLHARHGMEDVLLFITCRFLLASGPSPLPSLRPTLCLFPLFARQPMIVHLGIHAGQGMEGAGCLWEDTDVTSARDVET